MAVCFYYSFTSFQLPSLSRIYSFTSPDSSKTLALALYKSYNCLLTRRETRYGQKGHCLNFWFVGSKVRVIDNLSGKGTAVDSSLSSTI